MKGNSIRCRRCAAQLLCLILLLIGIGRASGYQDSDDESLAAEARAAMRAAAEYFSEQVAVEGGYVYFYSLDLQTRLGEGAATPTEIWVQPPGTPEVGMALIEAYRATGDRYYLLAADRAAAALLHGQLESGCWTNSIDFDPNGPRTARYQGGRGRRRGRNFSTLDDDITQSTLRFLMQLDREHGFTAEPLHSAVLSAWRATLAAQFPNGAFPQGWDGPVEPQPRRKASFPDYDWKTEHRIKNYWDMYTLNDGLPSSMASTLRMAIAVYDEDRFRGSLRSLGEFLIDAQMPDPQPAWAQQYNYEMRPIWARKFEPAAISSHESFTAIAALMLIYEELGDERFLEPIPAALEYLESSQLDDGRLARFYELQSNRPLYMKRRGDVYSLTYDDDDLPSHYGWKVSSRVDALRREFQRVKDGTRVRERAVSARHVRRLIDSLDDQGRWTSLSDGTKMAGQARFREGDRYLSSRVFSNNLSDLARFVAQTK